MAVPVDEFPKRGKSIANTRLKPIVLSFITDDDISHIALGFDSTSLRKKRLQRFVDQAFDHKGLSLLSLILQLFLESVMLSSVYMLMKYKKMGSFFLLGEIYTTYLVQLLIKEKLLLFTYKAISLQILL